MYKGLVQCDQKVLAKYSAGSSCPILRTSLGAFHKLSVSIATMYNRSSYQIACPALVLLFLLYGDSFSFTGVVVDATGSYTLAYAVTGIVQIFGAVSQFVLIFLKPSGGRCDEGLETVVNGKSGP